MTLSLSLSPQAEAKLRERAAAAGLDPSTYAKGSLEDVVTKPSLDEILAPFRRQVSESGMSEEELYDFYAELRDEAVGECLPDLPNKDKLL